MNKKYYNLLVVDLVVYGMLLYLLLVISAGATIYKSYFFLDVGGNSLSSSHTLSYNP